MRKQNRKKKIISFCFLIVILLGFTLVSTTFGRFVYKELRNAYLSSKNFYFYSDKLKDQMAIYQLDNWSGVDAYSITINMNNYKNNLLYSNNDISYNLTYTCSSNISCQSTKNNGVIYTSSNTDYFIITLTPDINNPLEDGDSVWMEVTATSTSPYVESLSAKFVINVGKIGLSYAIDDEVNSPYLKVNITNTLDYYTVLTAFSTYTVGTRIDVDTYRNLSDINKANCASAIVTLEVDPNVVLIDMTDEAYLKAISSSTTSINGYEYVDEISFKVDALSSKEVRFYKVTASNNYTYPFGTNNSVVDVNYSY